VRTNDVITLLVNNVETQCDSPMTARMWHGDGAVVLRCVVSASSRRFRLSEFVPASLFHSNKLAINCRHSCVFDLHADITNEL